MKEARVPVHRASIAADEQNVYLDSRSGISIVDLASGKLIQKTLPRIYRLSAGSHNWTWHLTANQRMFTSGVLQIAPQGDGYAPLPRSPRLGCRQWLLIAHCPCFG